MFEPAKFLGETHGAFESNNAESTTYIHKSATTHFLDVSRYSLICSLYWICSMSCGPQDYKRCVPSPKLRRSQIQWSSRIVQSISANRLEPAFFFGICPIPVHWHFFRHWFWSWLCCESWSPSLQEHLAGNRCRRVARIQHLRVMGHVGQRGPGIAVIEKHTYLQTNDRCSYPSENTCVVVANRVKFGVGSGSAHWDRESLRIGLKDSLEQDIAANSMSSGQPNPANRARVVFDHKQSLHTERNITLILLSAT